MNRYITHYKANTGFSLIEALISLAVLSFGLLAIASFQGSLVIGSGYNKTRSEAMALAQQKLDDIRGYTTEEELVAKLKEQYLGNVMITPTTGEVFPEHAFADLADALLPSDVTTVVACADGFKTVPDANNPLVGTTQDFTRQWKYCLTDNELLYTVVEVSWVDMEGNTDMVALHSAISWKNPAAAVMLAEIPEEPQVPSATGRAYLGDGSVTDQEIADAKAKDNGSFQDNADGTFSLFKTNDGSDVALVDADTNEIVLTLEGACKTDNPAECHNFVQIKGRVYRDEGSSSIPLSDVYVLASDAAYCARVFDTGGLEFKAPDVDGDGSFDYKYYDYTCYLGGGWYGNIGLLMTGNSVTENDHVCVGDPNAESDEGWKKQELATRRVYRGLTYKRNPSNYNQWVTAGGFGPVDDEGLTTAADLEANTPLFFSKGIADGTQYPDFEINTATRAYVLDTYGVKIPVYPGRDGGHNYLVIKATGKVDATNCLAPAQHPDSAWQDKNYNGVLDLAEDFTDADGDGMYDVGETYVDANSNGRYDDTEVSDVGSLFANTPDDFVCFNDEYYSDVLIDDLKYDATKPYLNGKEDPWFRNYPYLDSFNGDNNNTGDVNADGSVIPADPNAVVYGAEAECRWDPSRPLPNMHLVYGTLSNMTSSGAYDLEGSTIVSSEGDEDCWFTTAPYPSIEKDTTPSGTSMTYVCRVYEWGDDATSNDGWEGSISLKSNPASVQCDNLAAYGYPEATLVHEYDQDPLQNSIETDLTGVDFICLNKATVVIEGEVTVTAGNTLTGSTVTATGTDGAEYDCTPADISGTSFTYTCEMLEEIMGGGWSGTISVTPPNETDYNCTPDSWIYSSQSSPVVNNATCTGPVVTRTISGEVGGTEVLTGLQVELLGGLNTGTCSISYGAANKSAKYSCDVLVDDHTDEWGGSILITPPSGVWCSNTAESYPTLPSDVTRTASACEVDTTGPVYVTGTVYAGFPSDTYYANFTGAGTGTDTVTTLSAWLTDATGNTDGTCTFTTTPTLSDGIVIAHAYSCTTNDVMHRSTWSGAVNFATNGTTWAKFCYPDTASATASVPIAGPLSPGDTTALEYYVVTDEQDVLGFVKCPNTP